MKLMKFEFDSWLRQKIGSNTKSLKVLTKAIIGGGASICFKNTFIIISNVCSYFDTQIKNISIVDSLVKINYVIKNYFGYTCYASSCLLSK